jgi:hypothetical protein
MPKAYVKISNSEWGYRHSCLEFSDGQTTWSKNLLELTSYIGVSKNKEEVKKKYCEYISELIGLSFTTDDLDKIITPKYYRLGILATREYEYIVEANIKAAEQGKEPVYGATSLAGSKILNILKKGA